MEDKWGSLARIVQPPTAESLRAYIETGRPTGSFLEAVISNNLKNAFARADSNNLAALEDLVGWMYNYAPLECWGSEKRQDEWIKRGGLQGK